MVAQTHFTHRELEGISTDQMQEKLWQERNINWNDFEASLKRGRFVEKQTSTRTVEYIMTGESRVAEDVQRSEWVVLAPPIFTQNRDWLMRRLPVIQPYLGSTSDPGNSPTIE